MDRNVYSNSQKPRLQEQRRDYSAEENSTEEEEEDDDRVIVDPGYEYFLENLRPFGKSYVLHIIEDNVLVKYHDESATPEAVTDCEIENANHVSKAIMDTEMHPPANYERKRSCRGRKPKDPKLHADKRGNGSGSHVASGSKKHGANHYGKHRGRKSEGQKLFADNKNSNGSTSRTHVTSEPQKYHDESSTPEALTDCEIEKAKHVSNAIMDTDMHHPANYERKRRGRKPKDPKLHADKSGSGNGNHVDSEAQKHESNHYGKHRDSKPKGEKLFADNKSSNGSTSRTHVASEQQKHVHNQKGMRRGRKPKEAPKLLDTKNPNGINNHVASEAYKHTGRHRVKRARKNVPSSVNPDYEYFLENFRPNGKSYVLDIIEDNLLIKSDDESSIPEAVTDLEAENANHVSNAPVNHAGKRRGRKPKGSKLHADKNGNGSGNHVESEAKKNESNHYGKRRGRKPKGQKLSADKNPNRSSSCKHVASEPQKHVSNAPVNYMGKRRGRKPKGPKLHADKSGEDGNGNHVASEAQKHESTPPCIATRVKEENEDYDDAAPPSIRRPVQDPVLNFWNDDEANAMKLTKYREKLMEELKMPYSEEEYERLLKDITVRKPVQGKRELRRIKIYGENYDGKSLLDHHIDLKNKIDSARDDHPKVLNLLRGFFYWLKNLSHEGAFMPWRDPSCLDVLS